MTKCSRLLGTSALATLLAGATAQAALADTGEEAVLKVRKHVEALAAKRAAPARDEGGERMATRSWTDQQLDDDVPLPRPMRKPAVYSPRWGEAAPRIIPAQAQIQTGPTVTPVIPMRSESPAEQRANVLTRPGVLVIDPTIEYQHSNVNTFVAGGLAVAPALIGVIEATQANRDSVTATFGLRYGLLDRWEVEVRVPYMYRNDTVTNTLVQQNNAQETTSQFDHGVGDVEFAAHYQINDGRENWPIFVANVRAKSATGKGPYDVQRDDAGVPQELATGSGTWGVEPSITMIMPSDPAVFFANVGYLYNFNTTVNKAFDSTRDITDVEPGGALRLGMGLGLALNEKVSFSVGYQHDFIFKTTTKLSDGSSFKSADLSVGSLNFGVNWQMTDNAALNVSVGIGVTDDAPDVRLMARVPISIQLF